MLETGLKLVGRYEIIDRLGAGGMGEVYRARDLTLRREVAVKVLPEHLARNQEALSRFEREARALAALSHPHIITIYDFGTENEISFAVMELLKGDSLRKRLQDSRPSTNQVIDLAIAICDGLAAAHSAGVIHRDLKPENIFLTAEGGVKILDFGLARLEVAKTSEETSEPTITRSEPGAVLGTLGYMSPEQIRGGRLDARSDIFSFGCVLYEMLSGKKAFVRSTAADTISAILNEHPTEAPAFGESIAAELKNATSRCLRKAPEERFQTASDLGFALRMVSGRPAASTGQAVPLTSTRRIRPLWAFAAFLLLGVLSLFGYRYLFQEKAIHSLAILPFANVSGDEEAEYLSDGIAESIIATLSQLPQLRIMARDTVISYKGKQVDPRNVGRDLNVEAIVTGRVLQQGDTLVVRAHLVNVADGRELWGQQYNRKMKDMLAVQEQISREISDSLQLQLTGDELKRVAKHQTQNSDAYQLYLKGRYHWYRFSGEEDYKLSIEYYQQAIAKDWNYALAYSGLAETYTAMSFDGFIPPAEGYKNAREAAMKALKIDDSLGEVYFPLAEIIWGYDWNLEEAAKTFRRGLELNPNNVPGRRYYSQILLLLGKPEEAILEMKRALDLDPLSLETNKSLAARYYWAGRYDQAIEQFKKTIQLDPNYAPPYDFLDDIYARKKMYKEAIEAEQKYLNLLPDEEGALLLGQDYEKYGYHEARRRQFLTILEEYLEAAKEQYISPMTFATLYASLQRKDHALNWLEKAYEEHAPYLVYIHADPDYEFLRSEPKFQDLMKRIASHNR